MTLQEIHHRFYSFRNGIVAKAFHDAGDPHPRIFGLQLPQLSAIAKAVKEEEPSPEDISKLANKLWAERDCREARLLACYLFDASTLPAGEAVALAEDVVSREEADILAWRFLRHLPYAQELVPLLSGYIAEALSRNLSSPY